RRQLRPVDQPVGRPGGAEGDPRPAPQAGPAQAHPGLARRRPARPRPRGRPGGAGGHERRPAGAAAPGGAPAPARRRPPTPAPGRKPSPGLSARQVAELARMEHVEEVTPSFTWQGTVALGGKEQAGLVRTAAEDDPGLARRVVAGRPFRRGEKACLVSEYVAYR